MYVSVNSYTLKSKMQNVDSQIQEFGNGINNISNTINNISSIWRGNDYNYFLENMQTFVRDLQKLETSMKTYSSFIKGYISSGEKIDQYYKDKKISLK